MRSAAVVVSYVDNWSLLTSLGVCRITDILLDQGFRCIRHVIYPIPKLLWKLFREVLTVIIGIVESLNGMYLLVGG